MENQNVQQPSENENSYGLFLPVEFSGFRVFFWYSFVFLIFSLMASVVLNSIRPDGTLVVVFGYLNSLCFGFAFLYENRIRWFKGKVYSALFIFCLVLWALFSIVLAFLFLINTIFVGGLH
ncbi:MAG: hypothetical protein ACOYXC_16315 [Candidatus Rifleibacteriota bacterium]